MAYTPKTWQCGETIMADDLNHMEQGIAQGGSGSAPLAVSITTAQEGGTTIETMDKTWQEIYDAFPNVYQLMVAENGYIKINNVDAVGFGTVVDTTSYMARLDDEGDAFVTNSANGYPTRETGK